MKKKLLCSFLVLMLVALVVGGCGEPASPQTLKIGMVCWLGWPNGLEMSRGTQLMVDMDNENGGLDIGGTKYQVELIVYDSNNDQATAVAAVNKLIFEDEVKFILADPFFMPALLPITEANKVILAGWSPDFVTTLAPDLNYHFDSCFFDGLQVALTGWFCDNYPDEAQDIVIAYPDNQMGHANAETDAIAWAMFGGAPTAEFYPADATDLSALGTKVMSLNPSAFSAVGGGPVSDGLAFKAVYQAGYRGQFFATGTQPALTLAQLISPEALEGFICGAFPIEFDPALTQMSKDFKAAWIAEYGAWEGPEIILVGEYAGLRAALQQAGSLDTDEVMEVVTNGMEYEGPTGAAQMISRPDIGNNRTVDSISTIYVKQIVGGEPTLLGTISIDEGLSYFRMVFPPQ